MKVNEIKKVLKAKGLSRNGNKAELIATYLSNVGTICAWRVCCVGLIGFHNT
jgi:hypothetical protein